jgi:hypothetical protein
MSAMVELFSKKTLRIFGIIVLLAIICYVVFAIYEMARYSYDVQFKPDGTMLKLFKAEDADDVVVGIKLVRKSDVFHLFSVKSDIHVKAWEIKSISNKDFRAVRFTTHLNIAEVVDIPNYEKLNSGHSPETTVHLGPFVQEKLTVNIDKFAEGLKEVNGPNYKGYIGNINRLLISDENGQHKAYWNWRFDYLKQMVLAYTFENQLYLVVFYSKKDFDESIADILSLGS